MPGIAGIVEQSERLTAAAVNRLIERLAAPGERISRRAVGRAAMAQAAQPTDLGAASGVAARDGVLVAASGWVAEADRLWRGAPPPPAAGSAASAPGGGDVDAGAARRSGGRGGPAEAPHLALVTHRRHGLAELCLALYQRHGAAGLADQNGVYAVAVWDERARTLTLVQDRLGAAGLCYLIDAGRLAFASRPRALLALRGAELDGRALGHLLTVGYALGDRTLFRDIRQLGPATIATWCDGRLMVRRSWTPPAASAAPAGAAGAAEDAVSALDAALGAAVEAALADRGAERRVVLPLSGGLDSRALLGYLRRHTQLSTYSYGHRHAWDRRFGGRLARVAGTRHRALELHRDFMARYGARLVFLTEGQASLHAGHLLCLLPWVARRPSLVLSGYLGDALTGSHLGWVHDADLAAGDLQAQGRALFERAYRVACSETQLGELLRRPFAREARGAAREDFLAVYRQGGEDLYRRADRVDLELRQRRHIAYQLEVLGNAATVRAPFADHRVIDTCLALPLAWRRGQLLYRRLLRTAHPDLARVPVTASGLPLAGPRPWMALRRRTEELRWRWLPRLSRGLLRPHDYRQYAHYDAWIRTGARGFFAELLDDRELLDDVFDTEKVSDLLKAHLEGRIDAYQVLCAVATVGLWLRLFVRGGSAQASASENGAAAIC